MFLLVYLHPIYKIMSSDYNSKIAENIKSVLHEIGENPTREGLLKTPCSLLFITYSSYKQKHIKKYAVIFS